MRAMPCFVLVEALKARPGDDCCEVSPLPRETEVDFAPQLLPCLSCHIYNRNSQCSDLVSAELCLCFWVGWSRRAAALFYSFTGAC